MTNPAGGFLPGEPGPFDQADGARDVLEDAHSRRRREAFEAAAATTGDTHGAAWHFLFSLQQAAETKRWDDMRRLLGEACAAIPFHAFSLAAFGAAAAAGKLDIVEVMFARGFRLSGEDGDDALAWLATRHSPAALPVVDFLVRNHFAAPASAVLAVAAEGEPAALEALRAAGSDIQQGGGSFALAFNQGNTDVMNYLWAQGAELCRPEIAKTLHGGLQAWQENNRDRVLSFNTAHTLSVCCRLLAEDREKWRALYAGLAGENTSLAGFRAMPPALVEKNMTLMQAACRAGRFGDVIAAAARETQNPLTAADLLREDKDGASILAALAVYGEAAQAFDARAWFRRPEGVEPLREALKELGAAGAFDPEAFAAGVRLCRLKEQQGSAQRPGLGGKRPRG